MEKHYSDSTFLARWISGELSSEELEAFKKSKDYAVFNKINEASQLLETPSYNNQVTFEKLLEQSHKKPKVVKLIPNWAYAVAASVVLAFALLYAINFEKQYQTQFGEEIAFVLPDDSSVKLNANSLLEHKLFNWDNNRLVNLNGEAFFDVEKGTTFKVATSFGDVQVLGTEFNVIVREDYFEVICFEGKVRVSNDNHEVILTEGSAFRLVNNLAEEWITEKDTPNWLNYESSFRNTPLSQVVIALENEYKLNFDKAQVDLNKRFTGSFTHSDLNLALKTVFNPMEISYELSNKNTIILAN